MAWIESHQSLASHRKTMRLSRQLKISIPEAIGHLHCLWWWGLDNTPDGNLAGLDPLDIAMAGLWEGDADTFLGALIDAGFIDREEGHLAIHDWWEFAGKLIDRRRQDAERKRTARQQETSPSDTGNGTGKPQKDVQRTSEGHPTDVLRTVPNPTEQYRSNTSSNKGGGVYRRAREEVSASTNGKPSPIEQVVKALGLGGDQAAIDLIAAAVNEFPSLPCALEAQNCKAYYKAWNKEAPGRRALLFAKWLQKADLFRKEDQGKHPREQATSNRGRSTPPLNPADNHKFHEEDDEDREWYERLVATQKVAGHGNPN